MTTFEGVNDGELRLTIHAEGTATQRKRDVLLILVVDCSGSMSGTFERQVIPALISIIESCYQNDIEIQVILYQSSAFQLTFDKNNYRKVVSSLRAGGGTNFDDAFEKLRHVLTDSVINKKRTNCDVVVGFMTDGCGTFTEKRFNQLRKIIQATHTKVVVHSVAFTESHDFALLNRIRQSLGTVEGGFQYAEPSDGEHALRQKLEAIFEVVSNSAGDVNFQCQLPAFKFMKFLSNGKYEPVKKWCTSLTLNKDGVAEVTLFVRYVATQTQPAVVTLKYSGSMDDTRKTEGTVTIKNVTVADQNAVCLIKIKQLESAVDNLIKVVADTLANGDVSVSTREAWSRHLQKITESIQKYAGVNLLKTFKKANRSTSLEILTRVNEKISRLNEVLTTLARGEVSTALKARLTEITYGHKFAAARTQRKMDERTQKNIAEMKTMEDELTKVTINKEIVNSIPEALSEVYRCILTQVPWTDLVCDEQQSRDVVGFGVAAGRSELVIEDPTQIRISEVSLTILSKSAFEDALKFSIDIKGHLEAHGGFNVMSEAGVAFRGIGREPINSWLPLYIHPEHWKLVCPQLKAIIGHFVTLDPLGYSENQIDSLFLVMATMVARLSKQPGERELILLYQFQRTMIAIVKAFNWQERMLRALNRWMEHPKNRLKDSTKNLLVFVAYLLCLPVEQLATSLSSEDTWTKLWLTLLEETVRRGADNITKNLGESQITEWIDRLVLYDQSQSPKLTEEQINGHLVMSLAETAVTQQSSTTLDQRDTNSNNTVRKDIKPEEVSTQRGGRRAPRRKTKKTSQHGGWKRSRRNPHPPRPKRRITVEKSRDDLAVKTAQELVFRGATPVLQKETIPQNTYDPCYITTTHLNAIEQFVNKLNQHGHPTIHALMTLMTYTRQWIKMQRNIGNIEKLLLELDNNAGVAPTKWIQDMKEAFKVRENLRSSFAGFFQLCPLPSGVPHRVLVMRAMTAQGLKLAVNKEAKEAIEHGNYRDPVFDCEKLLQNLANERANKRQHEEQTTKASSNYDYAVERCVNCLDMVTFVGFLLCDQGFKGRRNFGAFKTLCRRFVDAEARDIPLGFEKLKVLITGKVQVEIDGTRQTYDVLDHGRPWIPGNKQGYRKKLVKIWGPTMLQLIESPHSIPSKK